MKKIVLFLALFFTGCQITPFIAPVITGIVIWKDGEATKYYTETIDVTYRHTKSALRDLTIPIKADKSSGKSYQITAGDRNKFRILIQEISPSITKVSIRINFLGDKSYADLVYKAIDTYTDTIEFDNGHPAKKH